MYLYFMKELIKRILFEELHYWTKEEVLDLASNFTTMNQFKKTHSKAYGAARYNKWLDDVRLIMKPAYDSWTEDKIRKIASQYNNLQKFADEQPKALDAARYRKIYDDVTKHMSRAFHFWTKDEVLDEALKYKYRIDFVTKSSSAYQAAVHNGWYDEATKHMDYLGNLYKRLVYAYEFSDNTVYVGLTLSKEKRNLSHITNPNSPVFKYSQESGLTPEMIIISDEYIDSEDAQELEDCTVSEYRLNGWRVLNKAKPGGLGSCKRIWTEDKIIEIALKYTKMNDFKTNSNKAYQAARSLKILDKIRKFMTPVNKSWTPSSVKDEMLKYSSLNQFRKQDSIAFQAANRILGYDNVKQYFINKTK
jgi:hypothetical protein